MANLLTQTILNILLRLYSYHNGRDFFYVIGYFFLELLVFLIEGFLYSRLLHRYMLRVRIFGKRFYVIGRISPPIHKKRGWHPWQYAFMANLASFMAGIYLADWLPYLF